MVRPKKNEQIENIEEAIKQAAWQQIADNGAAGLSLRGVARELGITAPAIYTYFPRKDELVTTLIVDAYREFGDAQYAALEGIPERDHHQRLGVLGLAYREWALRYPERYQLIFGAPVADYKPPMDVIAPVAMRSINSLAGVLMAAYEDDALVVIDQIEIGDEMIFPIGKFNDFFPDYPKLVYYLSIVVWGTVHGLVMLEIHRNYPPVIRDFGELYRTHIQHMYGTYLKNN